MINNNVMYSVTGRYMEGQRIIGYHLVGEDGSQARESRDRVIYLIGRGIISNMRTQVDANNEIIIRGKGVNLNKLPVYDQAKQQFRNNDISQSAASSKVSISKSNVSDINKMGQYTIVKRIMFKNQCLGYVLQDYSGRTMRMSRDKVMELAVKRLLSNAVANKVVNPQTNLPGIILRGVGVELRSLPCLLVDESGNLIDPATNNRTIVRSTYMKHNGILIDNQTGVNAPFVAGDFLVCACNGIVMIEKMNDIKKDYNIDKSVTTALCDDYIVDNRYSIEVFGREKVNLTKTIIKNWTILKAK